MKHQGFYEVGAQVIPLLFFALLFELRWFEGSGKRTTARFALFDIAVIVLAAVGELVCIVALVEDRTPTEVEQTVVIVAITFLFLPAIIRAARPRLAALGEAWPPGRVIGRLAIIFGALALFVLPIAHVRVIPVVAAAALAFVFVVSFGQGIADDWAEGHLDFLRRRKKRDD
jgi:hypothetical protein